MCYDWPHAISHLLKLAMWILKVVGSWDWWNLSELHWRYIMSRWTSLLSQIAH